MNRTLYIHFMRFFSLNHLFLDKCHMPSSLNVKILVLSQRQIFCHFWIAKKTVFFGCEEYRKEVFFRIKTLDLFDSFRFKCGNNKAMWYSTYITCIRVHMNLDRLYSSYWACVQTSLLKYLCTQSPILSLSLSLFPSALFTEPWVSV